MFIDHLRSAFYAGMIITIPICSSTYSKMVMAHQENLCKWCVPPALNDHSAWLPANLIQAQRDYFSAHTFERIDAKGTFHTQWEKE
jgi:hypothetical protein